MREHLQQLIELFATTIRAAIKRGECRRVDPHKTATSIEATYEGLTVLWVTESSTTRIDEMIEHSTRMILDALSAERS